MTKLPALTPDDPLRASSPTPPATVTTTTSAAAPEPAATTPEMPSSGEDHWSGATDVTTVRVPVELLRGIDDRAKSLGLPKGMIIAAGMINVLQHDDDNLVEIVEDTQLRYDRARRRARRGR